MSRNTTIGLVVVILLILLGWYFIQSQKGVGLYPATTPKTDVVQPTENPTATSEAQPEAIKEIMVEGSEFKFSPASLTLKVGEKVRIIFQNKGSLPHNLTIDQLGVATKTIGSGAKDTIEFTATKDGTFTMYCSVGNHRARGMEGPVSVQ